MTRGSLAEVPILTYHSIDESRSVLSTSPARFRDQMRSLREQGYVGMSLSDLFDLWDKGGASPGRPVVLTFDDGFSNIAESALPVLNSLSFSATIFVVAAYCGRDNGWPSQPPDVARQATLTTAVLRDLVAGGFEIGSHSLSHADLSRASSHELEEEIVGSKAWLQDELGVSVNSFAYPYGAVSEAAASLVADHYRVGCTTELRYAQRGGRRELMPRLDSYYLQSPRIFQQLSTPLGHSYLALRHAGRLLKSTFTQRLGAA